MLPNSACLIERRFTRPRLGHVSVDRGLLGAQDAVEDICC